MFRWLKLLAGPPIVVIGLVLLAAGSANASGEFWFTLPNRVDYSLATREDVSRLASDVAVLIKHEEAFLEQRKAERKRLRQAAPLAEMSATDLRGYFAEAPGKPTNNELRGLKEIQRLAQRILKSSDAVPNPGEVRAIVEIARSIENLDHTPLPDKVEGFFMPVMFLKRMHHPVGRGRAPAANIDRNGADLSRVNPPESSFWRDPRTLGLSDLFHSHGRTNWPRFSELLWEYDEPKTSYGANPGFEVKHGRLQLKVKFGEVHSEPFAARVFYAMGYHVDQTDYAPEIKVKYDRRMFREFHQRRELHLTIVLAGFLPCGSYPLQKRFDPFRFVSSAVLKDGTRWNGREFKRRLLRQSDDDQPEDDPANFNREVEEQIDYVTLKEANVQLRDEQLQNIGPWEFSGLGHENLRELRGAGLLAAWIGWFDSRFDNTRLKIATHNGEPELRHYFSDLGSGLGRGKGVLSWYSEDPERFAWTFTRREHGRFRIVNYRPIDGTEAFKQMTLEDARWMGRMIGRLSEEQILQALIASGFDSAEVRLFAEKLISRRDRMIRDLGLEGEIPLLRPKGVQRKFNYHPATEGAVRVRVGGGTEASAPVSARKVVEGRLVR